jgi:hypothetical protein
LPVESRAGDRHVQANRSHGFSPVLVVTTKLISRLAGKGATAMPAQ